VRYGITEPLRRVLSRFATRSLLAVALAIGFGAVGATSPATTGRIEGVVRLVAPDEKPIVSGAYPSRQVNKAVARGAEISNVIVFLRNMPRSAALPAARLEMVQQQESFVPRVLAVTRGSSVEFPNADPFFHNVFSLSRSATFDLGRFPRGERRTRTFTQAGLIKVYCHLHSHMSASIMVFDHPHFTVPSQDGMFVLNDVPAGEQRISAWHERIGESAKQIVVEAGRTARIEFALPVEDAR
jgi:plastocyanin